jgi:hypothetical protein
VAELIIIEFISRPTVLEMEFENELASDLNERNVA